MTSIPIAVKSETPQVVGPFTVTAAELTAASGGGYAGGVTLFTPAEGSLMLAAWSKVTETWVISDAGAGTEADADVHYGMPQGFIASGSVGGNNAVANNIGIADGVAPVRAYPATTFAASAGATKIWFLVVPTG